MRRERAVRAVRAVLVLALAGCAPANGPPAIRLGAPCTTCGMEIATRRFACERRVEGRWRVYDSIECLMRDGAVVEREAWLADYDSGVLERADSAWVVHGTFPTPMSGGFAAFRSRPAADSLAALTHGRVARLEGHTIEAAR